MVGWRKERKVTVSLLDFLGRVLSGARPEIVTPATAPVISDILVECYLWAAQRPESTAGKARTEPIVGPITTGSRPPEPRLRYGNRNVA